MPRRFVSSLAALGLAALLALAAAVPASAAVGEWSTPVTLSEAGQDATGQQVVTDGTTITAIWDVDDGSAYRVQASSSGDGGLTWGTPVAVSGAGDSAFSPQLVTDGSTLTAIWSRFDEGSNSQVQVSSSGDGGLTWGTPVTLSQAGQSASYPQVVTDGTTITVIWYLRDGSHNRVQVSSSNDAGLTWGTPVTLSEAGQSASGPQLVTDGTTITATWYRVDDMAAFRVQVSSSANRGLTWSTPVTLSEAGGFAYEPQVVTDGATITATWYRWDGSHNRVQVSSSNDAGLTWGAPVTLSEVGHDAYGPQLATDGATITATWYRWDGSHNRVQVASLVTAVDEPAEPEPTVPELAATGAHEALAVSLLAGGLLLVGGGLLAASVRGRRTA